MRLAIFVFSGLIYSIHSFAAPKNICANLFTAKPAVVSKPLKDTHIVTFEELEAAEKLAKTLKKRPVLPESPDELFYSIGMKDKDIEELFKVMDPEGKDDYMTYFLNLAKRTQGKTFADLRLKLLKLAATHLKNTLAMPSREELVKELETSDADIEKIFGDLKSLWTDMQTADLIGVRTAQFRVMNTYLKASRQLGRTLYPEELEQALKDQGLSTDFLFAKGKDGDGLFADELELKRKLWEKRRETMQKLEDFSIFSPERVEKVRQVFLNKKRIILTSTYSGLPIDKDIFQSLLQYAKSKDAEIVVIPLNTATMEMDPLLLNTPGVHVMIDGMQLTQWLKVDAVRIMGRQFDPRTGLGWLNERGQSMIAAAARFDVETIATADNEKRNHIVFAGVGSLHQKDVYRSTYLKSLIIDAKAEENHRSGGLLLEKADGYSPVNVGAPIGGFHIRQLDYADITKSNNPELTAGLKGVYDLGVLYTPIATLDMRAEALVIGDLHVASLDKTMLDALKKTILRLRPKRIIFHDLFDGKSISHWEENNPQSVTQRFQKGEMDLGKELSDIARLVNDFLALDPELEIVVVASNHDHWLYRAINDPDRAPGFNTDILDDLKTVLNKGAIATSPNPKFKDYNEFTKAPLPYALINGVRGNPLTGARGTVTINDPKRVEFLSYGRSFKVGPEDPMIAKFAVELAFHGDKGKNGSRGGNLKSMAMGIGPVVFGHTHWALGIFGHAMNVGSLTTKQPYQEGGTSNGGASVALVSPLGQKQAMIYLRGQFMTQNDQSPNLQPNVFFGGQEPRVLPSLLRKKRTSAGVGTIFSGQAPVLQTLEHDIEN